MEKAKNIAGKILIVVAGVIIAQAAVAQYNKMKTVAPGA